MVETPVLYITFARPEYARQSFAAVKKAKPKKLYFYSNKSRKDNLDELTRNEQVRSYVKQIDWDCEVKIWFREEYVDVYTSLWGAIDWVFSHEEKAIIIEEDVVASLAFFDFVDKIIDRYKDDHNVWMISGNNCTPEYNPEHLSFWGTRFIHIFGWASWRDRWTSIDREMQHWSEFRKSKAFNDYWGMSICSIVQRLYFDKVYKNYDRYNPWDYVFAYNMVKNRAYCIVPKINLVADVGVSGVHHKQQIKSPYRVDEDISREYDISNPPSTIEPTSYDEGHFYSYILKGLIRRKIIKFLGI